MGTCCSVHPLMLFFCDYSLFSLSRFFTTQQPISAIIWLLFEKCVKIIVQTYGVLMVIVASFLVFSSL